MLHHADWGGFIVHCNIMQDLNGFSRAWIRMCLNKCLISLYYKSFELRVIKVASQNGVGY